VVVEYIRYTFDDARAQAFEQAYQRSGEALNASPHCEQYEVSRCTEDRVPSSAASSRRSGPSFTTSRRCVLTRSPSRARHESVSSAGFGLRFLDRQDGGDVVVRFVARGGRSRTRRRSVRREQESRW
jgi:hypothetical protein